jgi:Na+/pantothenate symporter
VNDLLLTSKKEVIAPERHRLITRITMILIGVFVYFWGVIFMKNMSTSILNYLMLTGMMTSGGAIALLAGLYYKKANKSGAYSAIIICSVIPFLDLIVRKMNFAFYKVSPQQVALCTIVAACLSVYIFSLGSGESKKWIDYGKVVHESEEKAVVEI